MCPEGDPITDDEILYRRIPVSMKWYSTEQGLSPRAFEPRDDDVTGISVSRSKYKSPEEAGQGLSKSGYFVCELPVKELIKSNVRFAPKPEPGDPGHAELPDLNVGSRDTVDAINIIQLLSIIGARKVHGPYTPGRANRLS